MELLPALNPPASAAKSTTASVAVAAAATSGQLQPKSTNLHEKLPRHLAPVAFQSNLVTWLGSQTGP